MSWFGGPSREQFDQAVLEISKNRDGARFWQIEYYKLRNALRGQQKGLNHQSRKIKRLHREVAARDERISQLLETIRSNNLPIPELPSPRLRDNQPRQGECT